MRDPEALKSTFGDVLRQARLEKGLSQEKLALQAGLDRTFISLMERGKRQPSLTSLFALAEQLNTRPSDLLRKVEGWTD